MLKNLDPLTKLTLLLLSMMTMMSNVAIVTMLPHLKDHFKDVENIEFLSRLMITLPSLSIALLAPFLGHLVDKINKKRSAIIALILFGIAGSGGLYLGSIEELLASRALFGVAVAILMIVSTSLVGDYFEGEARHKFMGIQSAFIAIGGIVFIIGGGLLSDVSWRYPFAIYLIGFLVLPLVMGYIVEVDHHTTNTQAFQEESDLRGLYLLAFLLMLLFYILPTQMPFLMINEFGASGTLTGAIIATAFVSNAFGAISFAKLKKRFDFGSIYLIGLVIIGVGFILIGLVDNVYLFFATSPIMGFGGGLMMTNISAWMLHKAHHKKRVKSSGYLTSSLFLGQFFSPILFHPVVSHFGVHRFFEIVGAAILIMVFIAKMVLRFKKS
ncbi:MAG: MFS transporter [Campylobacterales bacterium]|nr:MFS transporter [Campylobacterales bacterium]